MMSSAETQDGGTLGFNGLSREAFEAGNRIKELLDGLDDETLAEVQPRLAQEVVNQAISRPSSDSELSELITTLSNGLAQLEERQRMERIRAAAPTAVDTNY